LISTINNVPAMFNGSRVGVLRGEM